MMDASIDDSRAEAPGELMAAEVATSTWGSPPSSAGDGPSSWPASAWVRELSELLDEALRCGPAPRVEGPGATAAPGRIGRFEVRKALGWGGYGVVLLALDPVLGRPVAVKLPRPQVLASRDARRRFLAEAQAAAGLSHPNLVPVYDFGEDGPICYIVYDYCEAGTLAGWLSRHDGPVPPLLAARMVADLADAVQHAHDHGILHCDLKPGNVLLQPVSGAGQGPLGEFPYLLKVSDFGLAKPMDRTEDESEHGAPIGTLPYMAREQAEGALARIGPATDVYGLGAILYEVLTRRPPFRGPNRQELLRRVLDDDPASPRESCPRIPRDLEAICLKCLKKSARDRYRTAAALADDLRHLLEGRPVQARPLPATARAWYAVCRHPIAAMLVAIILALAPGMAWLSWSRGEEQVAHMLQRLETADLPDLPGVVRQVEGDLPRIEKGLDRMLDSGDPEKKLRAALALATIRPECRGYAFDRLLGADPKWLRAICEVLGQEPGMLRLPAPVRTLAERLEGRAAEEPEGPMPGPRGDALARERANAAFALIRLGRPEPGWRVLGHRPDPRARSYLIHLLGPAGLPPTAIVDWLAVETSTPIRNALIQGLGEVPESAWAGADRRRVVEQLLTWYRDDPDPGTHGSAGWVLRRWAGRNDPAVAGLGARLRAIDADAKAPPGQSRRSWRVGPLGITLVALSLTDRGTTRRVEVADTEVTVGQFLKARPGHPYNHDASPGDDCPINAINGHHAMDFCNWLSDRDGIAPDQFAYRRIDDEHFEPFEDTPDRSGYRLLTDAEAVAACRAGSAASRFCGDSDALLGHYAWYIENADGRSHPVAVLRPNEFGLFDTLGNVEEWCIQARPGRRRVNQAFRGGSFMLYARYIKGDELIPSEVTRPRPDSGFRVARTIRD